MPFDVTGSVVNEGQNATFTFDNLFANTVKRPFYTTIDGTASTANGDYAQIFGSANIPAAGSTIVSTSTTADAFVETQERFGLLVLPDSEFDLGLNVAASVATAVIRDAGPLPAVVETIDLSGPTAASGATLPTLHIRDAAMFEGASGSKLLAFLVSLDRWSNDPVQFNYSVQDGTATAAGGDFGPFGGQLGTISGQSTVVFVQIKGDALAEAAENFRLVITAVGGAVFADNAVSVSATGTIFDSSQANSGVSGGIGDFGFSIFGPGADSISGKATVDKFDGGGGADTLSGLGGNDVLLGNGGDDRLLGGIGSDTLQGQAGNDTYGLANEATGVDLVVDSVGIDTITSTINRSLAFAGFSEIENLVLSGGAVGTGNGLRNTITGNASANTLNGLTNIDRLVGGNASDTYFVDRTVDTVAEAPGSAAGTADHVVFTGLANQAYLLAANVERLTLGGIAGSRGTGNVLNNTIIGNAGNNTLDGGVGNDLLLGQNGSDVVAGGRGIDTLRGGAQNDYFLFSAPVVAANRDIVADFSNVAGNNDSFRLENAFFTKVGVPGVLKSTAFKLSTQVRDADDRIIYNKAAGALFYDPDGSGVAGPIHFATLTNKPVLTFADFQVV